MFEEPARKYMNIMQEIKRRLYVVDYLLGAKLKIYDATKVEAIYLQFRKIIELITFSTLVTNKEVYTCQFDNYKTAWKANVLLKRIENLNPQFYPTPLKIMESNTSRFDDLVVLDEDYLTKTDALELLNLCGDLAHADNPFGDVTNYPEYLAKSEYYRNKIFYLLNVHKTSLYQSDNFWLVQMRPLKQSVLITEFGLETNYGN